MLCLDLKANVRKHAPTCGIDITKSITQNRKLIIEKFVAYVSTPKYECYEPLTVIQCQRQWAFFRRFEDGWPVRDMLAGYLVNQKAAAARRRRELEASGVDMKVRFADMLFVRTHITVFFSSWVMTRMTQMNTILSRNRLILHRHPRKSAAR